MVLQYLAFERSVVKFRDNSVEHVQTHKGIHLRKETSLKGIFTYFPSFLAMQLFIF